MNTVITGVSRGLGKAMARVFLREGHAVYGCSSTGQCRDSELKGLHHSKVNVASAMDVVAWAEALIENGIVPDLLINNAAIINRSDYCWKIDADEFDRVIDVNVKGTMNVIRAFLPAMEKRQNGVIINFSSGWGRGTSPEVAPYCASKWAIEGLTQALAQELPHGLSAIPLNPGVIDTDMLRSCFGSSASSYSSPEDWAERAVPFILGLGRKQNGKPVSVPA